MRKFGLVLATLVCMGGAMSAHAQEVGRYAIVPAKDGALILDTKKAIYTSGSMHQGYPPSFSVDILPRAKSAVTSLMGTKPANNFKPSRSPNRSAHLP